MSSLTLNFKYENGTVDPYLTDTSQFLTVLYYVVFATLPVGIVDRAIYHDNTFVPNDTMITIGSFGMADGDYLLVYDFDASQANAYDTYMMTNPEPLAYVASLSIADRSRGLFLEALKDNYATFAFVDSGDQTDELNTLAVSGDGNYVKLISNPSESVAIAAVTEDPTSLRYITSPSESVAIAAVTVDGSVFGYISSSDQTSAILAAAVVTYGMALQSANPALQTYEIVLDAVTNNGIAVLFAQSAYVNLTTATAAVTQNAYAILYVPAQYKTDPVKAIALLNNPSIALYL